MFGEKRTTSFNTIHNGCRLCFQQFIHTIDVGDLVVVAINPFDFVIFKVKPDLHNNGIWHIIVQQLLRRFNFLCIDGVWDFFQNFSVFKIQKLKKTKKPSRCRNVG
jgi:hypothetical protein